MLKCDFNKVSLQLYYTSALVFYSEYILSFIVLYARSVATLLS